MKKSEGTHGSRRAALYGLLTALALILSYIESLVPAFFATPGIKLGLTNLAVLAALYLLGRRDALMLNLLRILLSGLLFGNGATLMYSLAGGMLSVVVMMLMQRSRKFGLVGVSVAGGVSHNVGQILVAMLLLRTRYLIAYLPVLWFSGIAAGALIGLLGGEIVRRLNRALHLNREDEGLE